MRSRLTATMPLAALVAACASSGDISGQQVPTGCYYFEQDQVATALRLPWGIRLLDRPLEGWPALARYEDARLATTLTPEGDDEIPFGYWRGLNADSILVGYPGGGGLSVRATPAQNGLSGVVRTLGDATLDPPQVHAVRLVRARCPEDA